MKRISASLVAALGLLTYPTLAGAQDASKSDQPRFEESVMVTATAKSGSPSEYFLNFSGPVAVPGASLAPGTYIFRFPAPGTTRVIQVLKADRSDAYALFHTIPVVDVSRGLSSDAHQMTWKERGPDAPPAINAWFPPHQSAGYEFVYPQETAG